MDHLRSKRRMRRMRHASEHGTPGGRSWCSLNSMRRPRRRKTERFPALERSASRWKEQLLLRRWWSGIHGFHAIKVPSKTRRWWWRREKRFVNFRQPLRPRTWERGLDGQAQGFLRCHLCAGYFFASQKSMAAWHERKHQSAPRQYSREEPT